MLWTVLFQKLKRQPPKASQIYALLDNPKTHRTEKVYLKLKYDANPGRSKSRFGKSAKNK